MSTGVYFLGLKQKFIVSQLGMPEVQNQSASRAVLPLMALKGEPVPASSSSVATGVPWLETL